MEARIPTAVLSTLECGLGDQHMSEDLSCGTAVTLKDQVIKAGWADGTVDKCLLCKSGDLKRLGATVCACSLSARETGQEDTSLLAT